MTRVHPLALVSWHNEALSFGRRSDTFVAIDPRANPILWRDWRNYFLEKFGKLPVWFREVERQHKDNPASTKSWTAPIDNPVSYTP
jgi:hypothetical protein